MVSDSNAAMTIDVPAGLHRGLQVAAMKALALHIQNVGGLD